MAPTLSSLLSQASLDDHAAILSAATTTLDKSKSDVTAQHARVVALLKLDRYEDALRALNEAGPALQSQAKLEHAYALYKTGGLQEALKIAGAKDVKDRALLHLAAQTAYRAEDFEQAATIYERLSSGLSELENESDLRINKGACDSQLLWQGKGYLARKTRPDREDLAHFETMYNAACLYIARGQPKQAELMLNRAIDFCSTSDELTEADKAAEVLPMKVQQIYVLCRLGKTDEADKLCASIELQQNTDPVTKHLAQTNILCASRNVHNPFLAQRLISSSSSLPDADRPFKFQESAFYRNGSVLDLKVGKSGGVSKISLRTIAKAPSPFSEEAASAGVLNAAAVAQGQTGKQALKVLLSELDKRPNDVGLLLTIVQLYVLTSNIQAATSLLESFFKRLEASTSRADQDTRFAPGLVAVLVSLYAQQNRNAHTKAELAKAAAHWRHKSKNASSLSPSILRAAGTALLEQASPTDLEAARETFVVLYATMPNEPVAKAGLVASSTTDAPASSDLTSTLPSIKDLTNGLDIAALESAGIPAASSTAAAVTSTTRKRAAAPEIKSTTNDPTAPSRPNKKLRKSRVPKEYDPDKKPDPERWLPMRDRSYYRPKKGKKKAGGGGGHQGGMATQGGAEEGSAAAPSTGAGGGGGVGKNKKKKGKK